MSNEKRIKTITQNPYDTEKRWISSTRILRKGEIAISSDKEGDYKVGDGVNLWKDLPYVIGSKIAECRKEIEDVNSNLDGIGYGENGAKNILDTKLLQNGDYNGTNKTIRVSIDLANRIYVPSGTDIAFSFTPTSKINMIWLIITDSDNNIIEELALNSSTNVIAKVTKSGCIAPIFGYLNGDGTWDEITVQDVINCKPQIELNSVITPYKPYIPSVKMISEEVTKQNESLADYNLDNKCGELGQGYCNFSGSDNSFVWIEQDGYFVGTKSPIDCVSGNIIKVKFDITPDNIVIQWNDGTHSRVDNEKEIVATVPSGVTKFCTYCSKSDITPQSVGYIGIYVNNGIDELKNDLNEKIGDYHLDFGYKSKSEVTIVTNKTITVSSNTFTWKTENDKTFMCTSNNPFSDVWDPTDYMHICGIIFKVVWDGTEYILLGHERDRSYAQSVDEQYLFGNTSLLGYSNSSGDDTIPFLVVVGRWGNTNADQKSLKILTNDTSSASHTISISRIEIDYKKIPPYYLDTLHRSGKLIHKGTGLNGIVIGMATDAGESSVAEGLCAIASGVASHAEGRRTTASGEASHAEGYNTTASGEASHAEGRQTTASGTASHAEGMGTKASASCQHVQGMYNIEDTEGKYVHIVGNGTDDTDRSNCHTIDKEGNAWYSGNVEAQKQVKGESVNINNKIDLLYNSSTESLDFVFK